MTRKLIWSLIGVVALIVLVGTWFISHFEYVPVTTWQEPGKEALRDPYLALGRLTERLGRPLVRISNALALDQLTPGGVLLLDRNRRIHVNARRAEALFEWVRHGGYLIVAAESRSVDDPILERLGIQWYQPPKPEPKHGADARDRRQGLRSDAGSPKQEPGQNTDAGKNGGKGGNEQEPQTLELSDSRSGTEPDVIEVRLPTLDKPLRLKRISRWSNASLVPTDPVPVWKAGVAETRSTVLHYDYGEGRITVFDDFDFLSNRQIGEHDHAELIWALIKHYQPQGEVRLATRLAVPSLWEWLAESASTALISGALLIAAWLLAIVPRFGGTLPSPDPERRSLAEHLSAVGRAVWRLGNEGQVHWETVVRQDLRTQILQRHPHIARIPASEQARILAEMSGLPETRVATVLGPPDKPSPRHFVDCVRTVQELEQRM
ncbi:DUF4350 domain-containing protein [Methylocaldum szegediense]|uniref:DUF4350 domain-containing protein n=1 Tax=Methylocaldum szegediense TaxID=73780 RepID=A0ABM9I3N5_9GAMM|nr:DUF4350 domain-containing protein [Methylocaldum szegediense]CAI8871189.1 conserved protein of unknown function [Methylocaldum szegediense]